MKKKLKKTKTARLERSLRRARKRYTAAEATLRGLRHERDGAMETIAANHKRMSDQIIRLEGENLELRRNYNREAVAALWTGHVRSVCDGQVYTSPEEYAEHVSAHGVIAKGKRH